MLNLWLCFLLQIFYFPQLDSEINGVLNTAIKGEGILWCISNRSFWEDGFDCSFGRETPKVNSQMSCVGEWNLPLYSI